MTTEASRETQARRLLVQGLLKRMRTDPFEQITVTQICQEAQVARQTYYRNYQSKRQMIAQHLRALTADYQRTWPPSPTDMEGNLTNFFRHLPFSRELLTLLQRHDLFYLVEESFVSLVPQTFSHLATAPLLGEARYDRYYAAFTGSTVACLLRLWVEGGFQESPQELAALAIAFFQGTG